MIGKVAATDWTGGGGHRCGREQNRKSPTEYDPSQEPTHNVLAHDTLLFIFQDIEPRTNRPRAIAWRLVLEQMESDGRFDNRDGFERTVRCC
jgi:hypothetical protein